MPFSVHEEISTFEGRLGVCHPFRKEVSGFHYLSIMPRILLRIDSLFLLAFRRKHPSSITNRTVPATFLVQQLGTQSSGNYEAKSERRATADKVYL